MYLLVLQYLVIRKEKIIIEKVYACLAGNWVCLNDDPNCKMSERRTSPSLWWKEGAPVYAPVHRPVDIKDSYYCLDYIHIFYKGKDWRINPMFIQIVTE